VLTQESYAEKVGKRFHVQEAKPVTTPMAAGVRLQKAVVPSEVVEGVPYQSAVGSIMYAGMATRVDLAFTVGLLSQFNSSPTQEHWRAAKRAIKYLFTTSKSAIVYDAAKGRDLIGYTDADWCGSVDDSKSTSGYVFLLAGAPVSWKSKKQGLVALSSTEAEYVAATEAAKEAIWLRGLLEELGFPQEQPTTLFCDNQSAIALVENPVMHDRTKHIKRKMHFVRDAAAQGDIKLEYCPTQLHLADILTKGLPTEAHHQLNKLLGLRAL
jgi:hypothetical protein